MNLEWRVIDLEERNGGFNTSLDLAVLESVKSGISQPTIIFTEWLPTVSLGNSQSCTLDVDEEACKRHGVKVVRRRSGGQAVYLDRNYVVFSIIAPKKTFPEDINQLRRFPCNLIIPRLKDVGVPAEFYAPDNIVVRNGTNYRTLGNAGQIITNNTVVIHGSVRYRMPDMRVMLDVLKVNGQKLQHYESEISEILSDVVSHNQNITKEQLKEALLNGLLAGRESRRTALTKEEIARTRFLSAEQEVIADKPHSKSRGVCHFFIGGRNLVPSLSSVLDSTSPSTAQESTIEV